MTTDPELGLVTNKPLPGSVGIYIYNFRYIYKFYMGIHMQFSRIYKERRF